MKQLLFIIVLTFGTLNLNAQDTKQIDDYLTLLEENNKLMATMTVTNGDTVTYEKAVGFADTENKIKNTKETKFRIGSITKAFTAVMIFQLIDEGKITLETPLSKFYPTIPQADHIKISNLLNHSSGIYNITNDPKFGEWMLNHSSKKMMLPRIFKYDLDFNPGEQTAYSNTNYMLLGYIIEILDSSIYAQSLERRIVKKINLSSTYYGGKIDAKANESHSYVIENESWTITPETDISNPGGS
jgi:CubicO group peptidase (beta-lactamase class C family)